MTTKNNEDSRAKPNEAAGTKSKRSHVRELQQQLLPEMLSLAQSGENPDRFRELLNTYNQLQVHAITELLNEDPNETLKRVRQQRRELLDITQPFQQALQRPDLTPKEMSSLMSLCNRAHSAIEKSLILEKELLLEITSPGLSRGPAQRQREDRL